MASFPLNGKVALITGAAKGIGFETARLLHQRGASVAIVDLDLDEAKAAAAQIGERTLALDADVTDYTAIEAATRSAAEHFGGIDIVVANAGIAPPTRPMTAIDRGAFERTIEVDLMGVWRTVHAGLSQIVERKGHIVVVASVYAFINGVLATPYAMSKAGVEQLGRSLRVELAPHGASASVAYFGFIDTALVRDAFQDPVAIELEQAFPAFITKRLTPADAGLAIVDGIERRKARIMAPKWARFYSVARGMLNPVMDAVSERNKRIHAAIRSGEAANDS